MVKQYLGDRPRADTLRPGEARGDGDVDVRGDDRVGVRGDGVRFREVVPELDTVKRLVGRLGLGELRAGFAARPLVAGDFDRVLGLAGTERVFRGDAALDRDVFLGDAGLDCVPRLEMGEPGTDRWWQQSSSSLSSSTKKHLRIQDHKYPLFSVQTSKSVRFCI